MRSVGFIALICASFTGPSLAQTAAPSSAAPKSPSEWSPSPHGPDDRLGALNYVRPEKTARAAKLVTEGISYSLGAPVGPETPAYGPRSYSVTVLQLSDGTGTPIGANQATGNDDLIHTWLGIGSQLDGLGHMGTEHTYYNGVKASDFVATDGLKQFSIHTLPPIATRGVLLDMTKVYDSNPVPDGTAFNKDAIKAAAKAADITLEAGDIVLFHTGKMAALAETQDFSPTAPGLGLEGARYLAELGIAAIGTDTWAVEAIPFESPEHVFPVHPVLLAEYGVYILENMVTEPLARDDVTEFFFVLGMPRLKGTVQAMVNPIALK